MSTIKFTQVSSGCSFEVTVASDNIIIIGEDTDSCSRFVEGIELGTITVDTDVTYWIQKPLGFSLADIKCIVITNYSYSLADGNDCSMLVIRYSCEESGGLTVPLDSIFVLKKNGEYYICSKAAGLQIAEGSFDWEVVVTKDVLDRWTQKLIKHLRPDAITIYPMGNTSLLPVIEDAVRGCNGRKILILIDMFDVGKYYRTLVKIQSQNPDVRFYDYLYFGESPAV